MKNKSLEKRIEEIESTVDNIENSTQLLLMSILVTVIFIVGYLSGRS